MEKFEDLLRRDDVWFKATLCAAVLVFCTIIIGTLAAFFASLPSNIGSSIDVVYKLGLLGAGIVTFFTVAWRGLLATQQVDAQRKQIDKLALQISANEESGLADLLQRGAELIAETRKKAHVAAGIAILQSVALSPNVKFSVQAMDLIADYVQDKYKIGTNDQLCISAISALRVCGKNGRYSDQTLTFENRTGGNDIWEIISGVRVTRYVGGHIQYAENKDFDTKTRLVFSEVNFSDSDIDLTKLRYTKCLFKECNISSARTSVIKRNTFNECDFSGAKIETPGNFPDLREGGNFYDLNDPPKTRRQYKHWSDKLIVIGGEEE